MKSRRNLLCNQHPLLNFIVLLLTPRIVFFISQHPHLTVPKRKNIPYKLHIKHGTNLTKHHPKRYNFRRLFSSSKIRKDALCIKLFIADDEAIIREGLRCLLDWETLGFTIAGEAANGDAALEFLLSETPDLVLLDIRMPGMSGLDVVRIAREHGYDGKVVILSGYSDFNYARTAIRYGVLSYLTKPIDEDELLEIVTQIRNQLDSDASARDSSTYRQKAYDSIIRDLLAGTAAYDRLDRAELHLNADVYQVIIYEKYSHRTEDASYRFSDLLRVTNQDHNSFDHITDDSREIILLKGSFATEKFGSFLERFQRQYQPQKDPPLDSLFLAYGRPVSHLEEIALSYTDASRLIDQRFFCEEDQHTLGYENLPTLGSGLPLITGAFLDEYADRLFDGLSSFSRSRTAEILGRIADKAVSIVRFH